MSFTTEFPGGLKHRQETTPKQSVHLHDWPKVNKKLIDKELEKQMEEVQKVVTLGLAQRKEKQAEKSQMKLKNTAAILMPTRQETGRPSLSRL